MRTLLLMLAMAVATPALAKLPPPTPEEQAAAEAKKAKAAEDAKRAAELLAKAQDRAAENYRRNLQAKGGANAPASAAQASSN